MNKNKGQFSFVNIGSSLLLTVFLIICLVAFAILSLSSAKSDYSLTKQFAEHKTGYYEASSTAEQILSEIDDVLAETARTRGVSGAVASSSYGVVVTEKLDGATIGKTDISCGAQNGNLVASYEVKIDSKQLLRVELNILDYTNNNNYYEIKKWQVISSEDWEGDNSVNLVPMD